MAPPGRPRFSQGAVADYLSRTFGGIFREFTGNIPVDATVTICARRDNERVSLTLVNLGTTNIFIAPRPDVSNTMGIRLGPNGGTVSFSVVDDGILPALDWWAVGDAAGGQMFTCQARRDVLTPQPNEG